MYKVFDSTGTMVRGNFASYLEAMMYKFTFGNTGWIILSNNNLKI